MKTLPKARRTGIVEQPADRELLIYDLERDKIYCLNEIAAQIYRACDGKTTFRRLVDTHNLSEDVINFGLDELQNRNLLEDKMFVSAFRNMTRREIIRKVGYASIASLPMIFSLVAPLPSKASSTCTSTALCACNVGTPIGGTCGRGETISVPGGQTRVPCPVGCTCTVATCGTFGCGGSCS